MATEPIQFRYALAALLPPSLLKPFGWAERLRHVIGLVFDGLMEVAVQGVQARMPGQGTVTALPYVGAAMRIRRGFAEPDASYAARLRRARPDWKTAGNPLALMMQLRGFVTPHVPTMRYVHNSGVSSVGWLTQIGRASCRERV